MNSKLKTILILWRYQILFFVAMVGLFIIIDIFDCAESALGAIWLFVTIPGFAFTTLKAIYDTVVTIKRYNKEGWPQADLVKIPEVEACEEAIDNFKEEIDEVSELPEKSLFKFLIIRIASGIVCAIGLALIVSNYESRPMCTIGTLILIAGVAAWNMAR